MNDELVQTWAAILNALTWPVTIIFVIFILRGFVVPAVAKGGIFRFKVKDVAEFSIEPAQGLRPPSAVTEKDRSQLTKEVEKIPQTVQEPIPLDYFFLNHTSFLRENKQDEFRQRTGVPLDHYDISVIVDSYFRGALDRIEHVVGRKGDVHKKIRNSDWSNIIG